MHIIITVLIALLLQSFSPASAAWNFAVYPGIGECTGTSVRYRDAPGTSSNVVGRLNDPDRVIVRGSRNVGGELWYEIEHPKGEGLAFVSGKYIRPLFAEDVQETDTYKLVVRIHA